MKLKKEALKRLFVLQLEFVHHCHLTATLALVEIETVTVGVASVITMEEVVTLALQLMEEPIFPKEVPNKVLDSP